MGFKRRLRDLSTDDVLAEGRKVYSDPDLAATAAKRQGIPENAALTNATSTVRAEVFDSETGEVVLSFAPLEVHSVERVVFRIAPHGVEGGAAFFDRLVGARLSWILVDEKVEAILGG